MRSVEALRKATRQKLQFLNGFYERLYCADLSLTAYYSTLKYFLSRAFRMSTVWRLLAFCYELGLCLQIELLYCENKLSAVRTYATKAVAVL